MNDANYFPVIVELKGTLKDKEGKKKKRKQTQPNYCK